MSLTYIDNSATLPYFWFSILDTALKERLEDSSELWGGEGNYQNLLGASSISAYQLETTLQAIYQRFHFDAMSVFARAATYFDEIDAGASVLAMLTAPNLNTFCDLLSSYSVHIHPLLKIFHRSTEQGDIELWMLTQEHIDEITLVSHLSLVFYLSVVIRLIRRFLKDEKVIIPFHINSMTVGDEFTVHIEQQFNVKLEQGYPARYFKFSADLAVGVRNPHLAELHNQLNQLAVKQLQLRMSKSFGQRLSKYFESKEVREINLDDAARDFNMSIRTLNRRLKQEGVSFRRLFDKYRLEQSMSMLAQQQNIISVAYDLGFADHSSFSRAFKRWTGCSPKEVLRQSQP